MLTTQHLQHYVNEHFRSVADLTKLDELLPIETKHTTQLHTELCAVRKNTDTLVQELTQATRQSQVEIQRLRSLHETIRQIAVASPDTNPLWADQLLPRHQRLQSLYTVQAYLSTVARANQLGQQIKDEASRNPQRTVALYHQLHDMVFALRTTPNHPPYPNLDQFLDGHLGQVWESIRATLVKRYIECLNALEWPKPIKIPAPKSLGAKLDALQHAFADMLLLERPRGSTSSATHSPGPVLFAMQTLTRPLVVRFRYHFESPRPTNRLDKPEWFLSHVVNSIRDHYPFLEEELQPVLDHSRSHEYRVKDEFIRVWVQCVEEKLRQDRGRYLDEPLLLAHTVQQLVEFDHTLTEVYFYQPPPPILPNGETAPTDWDPMDWPGTVDVLLADQDLFDHWLNAEKEFAADQYNELILDENAWALLYDDLLDPNDPHPTQSAEALFQLVEGIGTTIMAGPIIILAMRG
ncbi:TIP-1 family-domain-containing protein [Dimargaris cristalligena]|uniref:TIP-1 family-domain-containing protein n=1 Tax=Dimargaris cristalligena TaxID=215637 RepID=A0A4P9ZQT6_9FUNG|nr:TIP-1 family-domain-containing protein [Dimargaris cristalligena]|eukprot:RKP35856.1 TIP-1 family-domain-containing protein [Dimargaris cristalligena]